MTMVILADDEKIALRTLQHLIDWEGLDLVCGGSAENGIALLELILEKKPDIVITDICMPGLDGLAVIARTLEEDLPVRYIITSAYTHFEYARQAIRLGVEDFLPKPLRREELNETISRVLRRQNPETIRENAYSSIIRAAKEYIDGHYGEHLTLESMSAVVWVSPNYLSSLFKKELGLTFLEYLTDVRMTNACRLLREPRHSVEEIASLVGYKNIGHFQKLFLKKYGVSPAKYRRQ